LVNKLFVFKVKPYASRHVHSISHGLSVSCDYPTHTSAVYSRSCIPTVRSYTQYNLSSILQSFLHTRCSHTGTTYDNLLVLIQEDQKFAASNTNSQLTSQTNLRVLHILSLSQGSNCASAASLLFPLSAVTLCHVLNSRYLPSLFSIPAPATATAAVRQKSKLLPSSS
jgi:hypothetical protein